MGVGPATGPSGSVAEREPAGGGAGGGRGSGGGRHHEQYRADASVDSASPSSAGDGGDGPGAQGSGGLLAALSRVPDGDGEGGRPPQQAARPVRRAVRHAH